MSEDRLNTAMSRIENALARIETAAARPIAAASSVADPGFDDLQQRHSNLKSRTQSILNELNGLIAQSAQEMAR